MPRYAALLRAINVGGHVVSMKTLRGEFEKAGFRNVETFIASGNVIFETRSTAVAAIGRRIETALRKAFGYEVATFIRSIPELAAVAEYRPFPPAQMAAPGSSLYVMFLAEPIGGQVRRRLLALRTDVDDFHVHGREIYWFCRGKLLDSLVNGTVLARTIGAPTTMRNVNTVRRMAAKYGGS